jgi:hypothetical protein
MRWGLGDTSGVGQVASDAHVVHVHVYVYAGGCKVEMRDSRKYEFTQPRIVGEFFRRLILYIRIPKHADAVPRQSSR